MADNVQQWIDKCAIQELIYRHSDGVNRGDLAAVRSAYADDARWEIPLFGFRSDTADEFIEFLRVTTATAELLVQTPHCPVITLLDRDAARATTTVHEFTRGTAAEDGPFGPAGTETSEQHYGIYYDEVARLAGEWKFTHRVFVPTYLEPGYGTGHVLIERARLLSAPASP